MNAGWQRLCEENIPLAVWVVKRLVATHQEVRRLGRDDAEGEALLHLAVAARTFDPSRGYRFSTYATNVIRRGVLKAARHTGPVSAPCWYVTKSAPSRKFYREALRSRESVPGESLEARPLAAPEAAADGPDPSFEALLAGLGGRRLAAAGAIRRAPEESAA